MEAFKVKKLKKEVVKELNQHILPFWMKLKDEENGGFYGVVDYELNIDKGANKGGIAITRFLWSFSAAYRITKKEEYLEYAHHAFNFLKTKVYDRKHKGLYWMLDYVGNPIDTRKHIYTQAFGIYALSEYYRVANSNEALELAKELYNLIETKGYSNERNAYMEEFNREWIETTNEMLSENGVLADITTNTHLHIIEAYTNLYRVWQNKELEDRLINLIDIFYERIFNKKTKSLGVFFDRNWNEILDLKSFGHDIEASWLIDETLKLLELEKEEFINMVVDIAYNIADTAIQEDGSIINEKECYRTDYTRVWWGQAEAMVGFLNAYERTGDKRFLYLVKGLWGYTKDYVIDKRDNSEWFWSVESDGIPTKREIAEPWKTPYHNTRFCLEIIERVKE